MSFSLNVQIKREDAPRSKVLHIRNLPDSASEADVSKINVSMVEQALMKLNQQKYFLSVNNTVLYTDLVACNVTD
jgi:hypothetical protein